MCFSLDVKHDVDVALVVGLRRLRRGQRLIEEPQVGDVLVRAQQRVLAEHVSGEQHDLIADHPLVGDVVADDLDLVDDRRLALVDHPAEIDHRLAVGAGTADHVGADLRVDVPLVVVQRVERGGGVVPARGAEHRRTAGRAAHTEQAGALLRLEGEQLLQIRGGEAPVADDLEGAHVVGLALADAQHELRLAARVVHHQRVVEHLEVHEAVLTVELGQALLHVGPQLLVVVVALAPPPETLGPGAHVRDDFGVGEMRVAIDAHPGDGDAATLGHVEHEAHPRRVGLVDGNRLDLGQVVAARAVQRVDPAPGPGHGRGVVGAPLRQGDLGAHCALAEPGHAAHGPVQQDGPLLHADHEDLEPARRILFDPDVVELAGRVQRPNRPLDVAIGGEPAGDEPGGLEDDGGRDALRADGDHRIRTAPRPLLLSRGPGGDQKDREDGDRRQEPADHAFVPESARNARRSLSGATSTSISSPRANSPTRIFSDNGSSMYF